MTFSRKIPRFFQGPFFISSLAGIFVGLSLAAFFSGRLQGALTARVARHLEARLESVRSKGNHAHRFKDIRHLAGLSLWGRAVEGGEKFSPGRENAMPLAGVPYTLKGIVRYPGGTYEAVFYDPESHKTFFIKPGGYQGSMKVLTILPDRLIVEQGGKRGTIELFRERSSKRKPYEKGRRRVTSGAVAAKGRVDHVVLRKKEVQSALKDMASFLRQVRIVPNLEGGKAKGFKLLEIVPGSIVARAGLRNGDIIESVNGKPIQTPQEAFQLFTLLQSGKGVSLVFRRNHQMKTVAIDLR